MKPTKMRNMQIYRASAGTRNKQLICNVSKNLRLKHGKRNTRVMEGDSIKVVRGEYKGVTGKVNSVSLEYGTVAIDGLKKEKVKGEKFDVYIRASNIIITGLDNEDVRLSKEKITTTPAVTEQPKSDDDINQASKSTISQESEFVIEQDSKSSLDKESKDDIDQASESTISQESEFVIEQDSENDDLLDDVTKQDMKNISDKPDDMAKDATDDTSNDVTSTKSNDKHGDDMVNDDMVNNDMANHDTADNDTSDYTIEDTENSKDSKEERKEGDV